MGIPKVKDDLEKSHQYRNIRMQDTRSPDDALFTRQSNYATAVIAKGSLQYDDSSTGNQAEQSVVSSNFKSNTQVIKNFNDMVAAPAGRRNPSGSTQITYESREVKRE